MLLVSPEQIDQSAARYDQPSIAAKQDEPESRGAEKSEPDADLTVAENLEKRKEMLKTLDQEPVDFAFERAIGNNDSVYSNFCEFIMLAKRKVGRIVIKDGVRNLGCATGFMVSERLLLTNWHVFKNKEDSRESVVEFFYELDVLGNPKPDTPTTFKFRPDDFFHSDQQLDYCMVAVEPSDISAKLTLGEIGYHYLDPNLGKLGEEGKEKLNIIHHPDGDYKQLSIRENTFTKILDNTIWYETDTAPGSSGSPVYNDQWQVVALHHMGVPKRTADGKNYADRDGNAIPVDANGQVDAAKVVWLANEGIRISKVIEDVLKAFPNDELVLGLKKPSEPGSLPDASVTVTPPKKKDPAQQEDKKMDNTSDSVKISFPSSLIQSSGNINISISNRSRGDGSSGGVTMGVTGSVKTSDDLDEVKKLDIENSMDYSDCKGYQDNFLGTKIAIPKPKKSMLKFVAQPKSAGSSILKYYFFSTIHHSIRKMPMISAINVDGDPKKRIDLTVRKDVWLRDNRIDLEMQLDDKFYASSGFDKGHMSRREDADYGASEAEAKKHADLTCVYTNACPQVPKLNRSNRSGLWGKLEMVVLEKGAEKEVGKTSKISVFNGPIFDDENDRFFRGIQIPMAYWKIILWFNSNNELKATAFKLSQADLVGSIKFQEELDFNADAEFAPFQCSIASLEKATGLDLSQIEKIDTFTGVDPHESLKIDSEESLRNLVDEAFRGSPA
ncbi:MAG: DNA/RNA non-specific endonuclease [Acidobacteriota bacterium]